MTKVVKFDNVSCKIFFEDQTEAPDMDSWITHAYVRPESIATYLRILIERG
jgi:hypothetical protein